MAAPMQVIAPIVPPNSGVNHSPESSSSGLSLPTMGRSNNAAQLSITVARSLLALVRTFAAILIGNPRLLSDTARLAFDSAHAQKPVRRSGKKD